MAFSLCCCMVCRTNLFCMLRLLYSMATLERLEPAFRRQKWFCYRSVHGFVDFRGLGLHEWRPGDPSRIQVYRALVSVWSWAVMKFALYMTAFITDQDESSQLAFVFQARTQCWYKDTSVSADLGLFLGSHFHSVGGIHFFENALDHAFWYGAWPVVLL